MTTNEMIAEVNRHLETANQLLVDLALDQDCFQDERDDFAYAADVLSRLREGLAHRLPDIPETY